MPKVDKLMAMGFTKEQATKALEETSFNEELAANLLMQWRFGK